MKYFLIILFLLVGINQPLFAKKKSPKYKFKLATLAPERSIWLDAFNGMADEVFDKTDGLVKFKSYAGAFKEMKSQLSEK